MNCSPLYQLCRRQPYSVLSYRWPTVTLKDGSVLVYHSIPPEPEKPKSAAAVTKLSEERILEIRRLRYLEDLQQNEVGKRLGVSGMLVAKYAPIKSKRKFLKKMQPSPL
eukprot:EC122191.1.p1 GENE.EC122191.1~~EC122191.1.p1  ORF type:complete len:109 (+),score=0.33 EC122191.1:148-474(+)